MKYRAVEAIAKIGTRKEAIPGLIAAIKGPHIAVRNLAVKALIGVGKKAAPALAELLNQPDAEIRRNAVYILRRIGIKE